MSDGRRMLRKDCAECGQRYEAKLARSQFCCAACRSTFNNRRKERGAELYDLLMLHRFERAAARDMGALALMNRMASVWRQQDRIERAGRQSWSGPEELAERLVRYRATRF